MSWLNVKKCRSEKTRKFLRELRFLQERLILILPLCVAVFDFEVNYMYRVKTKSGSIVFCTIEDAMIWIVAKSSRLFIDGAFIKIERIDDFCEDFLKEDLE